MSKVRGCFITFEGIEGVGKTSNIDAAAALIRSAGIDVVLTREPGGTPFAEQLRDLLLATRNEQVTAVTELLLMFAARSQHIQNVINPALDSGQWVVCDRFTDATFAYQGGGRGVDWNQISVLEQMVQGPLQADMTIILDLDPKVGLTRASNRGALDRIEQEELSFFSAVREAYLKRAQANNSRYRVVDASVPLEHVKAQVAEHVNALVSDRKNHES